MSGKKIGILTGGGDVPGLNAVIKNVVYRSTSDGHQVTGIRRGWEGLTHLNFDDPESVKRYVLPLDRENTRTVDRMGGTFLHTSRTNPSKMKKLPGFLKGEDFPSVTNDQRRCHQHDVRHEQARAGESGKAGYRLPGCDRRRRHAELCGDSGPARISCSGVPKTMDNDVQSTEYCIGFSTAISRAKDAIDRQRTTVGSHERVGIFRVFGRDAGYTSLYTAYVTSIRCAIPEYQVQSRQNDRPARDDKRNNPSNYAW